VPAINKRMISSFIRVAAKSLEIVHFYLGKFTNWKRPEEKGLFVKSIRVE
jgi:hypothetical protein